MCKLNHILSSPGGVIEMSPGVNFLRKKNEAFMKQIIIANLLLEGKIQAVCSLLYRQIL